MFLIAARHGETDLPGCCRGRRARCELSGEGLEQTWANMRLMKQLGVRVLYTSELQRARIAGTLLADACHMQHRPLEELDAIDDGDWSELPWKEIERRWPDELHVCDTDARNLVIPGGLETGADFETRVRRAIGRIMYDCREPAGRIFSPVVGMVTHGCVIGVMDAIAHGRDTISLRDKTLPPGALRGYDLSDGTLRPLA
jgi:broad specificity phosphatase PhoE